MFFLIQTDEMSCRKRVLETDHEPNRPSDGPSIPKQQRASPSFSETDKREAHIAKTAPAELKVKTGTPDSKTDWNTNLRNDRADHVPETGNPLQEDYPESDACELIELYAPFERLSIEEHGE